ncbi:MAG: hypothetical protein HQK49_00240 [Oligoflexia bacterium]|nr:hypothetical protein [Oligoflexia bacterium]
MSKFKTRKKIQIKSVFKKYFAITTGAIMIAAIGSTQLFALHKTTDMHQDLQHLKNAMMFTIPTSIGKPVNTPVLDYDGVKNELIAEIDKAIKEEKGEAKFNELSKEKKELNKAREEKMQDLVYFGKYEENTLKNGSVFDGEIWNRRSERTHKIIMDAKKVNMKKGEVIEYNLSKEEVPYGSNFLPDNLDGISMRWNNGKILEKIIGYKTLFEQAWLEEKKAQKKVVAKLKKGGKGEFKDLKKSCIELEKTSKELNEVNRKINNLEVAIEEEENDKKSIELEKKLATEEKKLEEISSKYPGIMDLRNINAMAPKTFLRHNTDCYMILNYEKIKANAVERVVNKLKKMSQKEFDGLAPTEKYDILNGYYDFRSTGFDKMYKGKRRYPETKNAPVLATLLFTRYWEGRCNAARSCDICHRSEEPVKEVSFLIDEIGKTLSFKPFDTKALLMSTYFELENDKYAQLGDRNNEGRFNKEDLNPSMAAVDILLRSVFKDYKVPFIIDNHNDERVNNVTIIGFKRTVKSINKMTEKQKKALNERVDETIKNLGKNFKDYRPDIKEDSVKNPKSLYEKARHATQVMRVEVDLKLLSEVPIKLANQPTKEKIANEKAGKGPYTKKNRIVYDLYLTDDGEIVEGDQVKGEMDFLWFAAGKGNLKNEDEHDHYINYDVISKVAKKASGDKKEITRDELRKIEAESKKELNDDDDDDSDDENDENEA